MSPTDNKLMPSLSNILHCGSRNNMVSGAHRRSVIHPVLHKPVLLQTYRQGIYSHRFQTALLFPTSKTSDKTAVNHSTYHIQQNPTFSQGSFVRTPNKLYRKHKSSDFISSSMICIIYKSPFCLLFRSTSKYSLLADLSLNIFFLYHSLLAADS